MRCFLSLPLLIAFVLPAFSQQPASKPDDATTAVQTALTGRWTGVLEYRDYSEPATSTKRVQLPTWLTVSAAPEGVMFDYVYDDGPSKTVTDHHPVIIDLKGNTYKVMDQGSAKESYSISGADKLKNGRGELVLMGEGRDADKPAEIRTTLVIRRNLLSWLEEVRPAKSDGAFVFRHRYTFTRAEAPATTAGK